MPYARPIFASLAALFCLCLAVTALLQNHKSSLHRYFALFNFSIAIADLGELVVFIDNPASRLWALRLSRLTFCFVVPFFLRFLKDFFDEHKAIYRKILRVSDIAAVTLAFLHLTPLIYTRFETREIVGPLFPLFALYLFSAVGIVFYFFYLLRKSRGLVRQQVGYLILASLIGFLSLVLFFLSFVFRGMPRTYFPLQALCSFVFAYAIFKHSLVPAHVVLRRVMLVVGIYVAMFMALVPITYFFHQALIVQGVARFWDVISYLFLVGAVFSFGPIAYSIFLRQSRIFQEARISEITHEFQTPIAAIQGVYDVIDGEMGKPAVNRDKVTDYLVMLKENTARLERFVEAVLGHARADHTPGLQEVGLVDLADIYKEALLGFPEFRHKVAFSSDGDISMVGFRDGLKQIFVNLISNASKFCPDGPVQVDVRGSTDKVGLAVKDCGTGIAKENIDRIFTPFFKAGNPGVRVRGPGLGLSIVKKWVELHHGSVWAESDGLGAGTTFHVSFPRN